MYAEFFELKERPFSMSPDPRFIYLTDQHSEALAKCEYTIQEKMGLSVIHGDVGAGKTTLARRLWEKYAHNPEYNFAMLVDPNYPTTFQFINEVRRELNMNHPRRSFGDALNEFQDYLIQEHNKGKTTILVVDEAQTLRHRNYELLRKLLNFETNKDKMLQIVLFGQNELLTSLERIPALKDRVALFGALSGLTRRDTDDLIRFRWNIAGGKDFPFTEEALEAIFRITKGRPRKLCRLCDNALVAAYLKGTKSADEAIIREVAKDIRLHEQEEEQKTESGGPEGLAVERGGEDGPLPPQAMPAYEGELTQEKIYGNVQ
jgi:general secretion pathway protein A